MQGYLRAWDGCVDAGGVPDLTGRHGRMVRLQRYLGLESFKCELKSTKPSFC